MAIAVRFQLDRDSRTAMYDQVRDQIIAALHTGGVDAGAKLPSVRQFARVHGVNPKTVHRIYQRLHREGYVQMRPGSGAYVARRRRADVDDDRLLALHRFVTSTLAEGRRLGVAGDVVARLFAGYLSRDRMAALRVAVVERDPDQAGMHAAEVRDRLGVEAVPVAARESIPGSLPSGQRIAVAATADLRLQEALAGMAGGAARVVGLRRNPDFIPSLAAAARRGRLLVVLSCRAGVAQLREALAADLGPGALERVSLLEARDGHRIREALATADSVYISPLAEERVAPFLPASIPRARCSPCLTRDSLDLLEAALLLGAPLDQAAA